MSYDITTKKGSELLKSLGTDAGASVTATDGSVWTRQADGSVVARGVSGDTAAVRDLYTGSGKAAADAISDAAVRNKTRTDELKELYSAQSYDKMTGYLAEAAQVAAEQQIAAYNAQKESTQESYEKMLRQLYVEREQSEKNLSQLLAAAGLSGGASETTQLGLDTAYLNALQTETNERDAALRALDAQIAQARSDAQAKVLELYADAEQSRLSGYASALKAAIAEENDARDAVTAQADTTRSYALNIAQKILSSGGTPSEELLRTAGLSQSDADALYTAPEVEEQKPTLTLSQAISAIQSGTVSDAVRFAYDYYMGDGAYDRFAAAVQAQKKTTTAAAKKSGSSSSSSSSTTLTKEEKQQQEREAVRFTYNQRTGHYVMQGKTYQNREDFVRALRNMDLTSAQKKYIEQQNEAFELPEIKNL